MSETESYNFEVSGINHPRIEKYKPEFVGYGGQHVVYSLPDYPNKVVKVEADMLLRSTEGRLKTGKPASSEIVQERLDTQNKRIQALRDHFGVEHTLEQSSHYLKVPVSKELFSQLYKRYRKGFEIPLELANFEGNQSWSIVSIQEKLPELSEPSRMSVTSGYAEKRSDVTSPDFIEAYDQVTNQTIIDTSKSGTIIPEDIVRLHAHMESLLSTAKNDPNLQNTIRDFVQKSVQYTKDTGEMLDLAGQDNVIFFKDKNGNWTYNLPDALYPSPPISPEGKLKEVQDILSKVSSNGTESLSPSERNVLMNTVNYARVINGLANWLEVSERIDLIPENVHNIDSQTIMNAIITPDIDSLKRQ